MSGFRINIIATILIAVLFFLQYRLWFESDGMRDMFSIKKKLAAQLEENDKLKQHNDELVFQIKRLQNSDDGTETRARSELGMIKKGETFYQIVK